MLKTLKRSCPPPPVLLTNIALLKNRAQVVY